jgi:hypothetical protein
MRSKRFNFESRARVSVIVRTKPDALTWPAPIASVSTVGQLSVFFSGLCLGKISMVLPICYQKKLKILYPQRIETLMALYLLTDSQTSGFTIRKSEKLAPDYVYINQCLTAFILTAVSGGSRSVHLLSTFFHLWTIVPIRPGVRTGKLLRLRLDPGGGRSKLHREVRT